MTTVLGVWLEIGDCHVILGRREESKGEKVKNGGKRVVRNGGKDGLALGLWTVDSTLL